MSITRLEPFLYLLTPLGEAEAHFIRDLGSFETPITYGCFQCETKENWWWPNQLVRLSESVTAMRTMDATPFCVSDELFTTMRKHILRHKRSPLYARAANQ